MLKLALLIVATSCNELISKHVEENSLEDMLGSSAPRELKEFHLDIPVLPDLPDLGNMDHSMDLNLPPLNFPENGDVNLIVNEDEDVTVDEDEDEEEVENTLELTKATSEGERQ